MRFSRRRTCFSALTPGSRISARRLPVSGTDGSYTAPALRPGKYIVTVERAGFKKEVRSGLVLQVNQVATVDLALRRDHTATLISMLD